MSVLNASALTSDVSGVTATATHVEVQGGHPSTEALVRAHLPLVGYVVNELSSRLPSHLHRDDLVSAGMSGLAEAAAAFDASNGVPFHRYAAIRIKGAMLDELRANDWASRGARSRTREVQEAEERLGQRLQRRPQDEELAADLKIDVAELDRRRAETARALISLDAGDAGVGFDVPDQAPDPMARVLHNEQLGYLRAAVRALPERSRSVVMALFFQQRSISEVAAELDVTESRVSQLKTEALGLLQDALAVVHAEEPPVVCNIPAQGVAQRRRQQYYASVAAHAAAAGLGAALPPAHQPVATLGTGNITRSPQREPLRSHGSVPMRKAAGHGWTA